MHQDEKEGRIELAEGLSKGRSQMCDYSLYSVKSRPAKISDKLTVRDFGTGTRGFAASQDATVAVCVLPGTELAFAVVAHHDALEFPDGQIVLLTSLSEDQQATVLQLPAEPKTVVEFEAQRRAAYVG